MDLFRRPDRDGNGWCSDCKSFYFVFSYVNGKLQYIDLCNRCCQKDIYDIYPTVAKPIEIKTAVRVDED